MQSSCQYGMPHWIRGVRGKRSEGIEGGGSVHPLANRDVGCSVQCC